MSFKRGQVVVVTKVDPGDDPRWLGLMAEVADTSLGGPSPHLIGGDVPNTRLVPLQDRPDGHFPHVDPRGWFFWPTSDLELVEDGQG